ncbi:hypothetical protein [Kutzneria sp. NPDC051319]|uniref:hypothetical protein n=1 Tax=Kutzneria sp. NPDC051319 TaxID=3155047 RepID=UPI00342CA0E5
MDNTQISAAVWRPAEQWQADDTAVELRLKVMRRYPRNAIIGIAVSLVLALLVSAFRPHVTALSVVFVLNAVRLVVVGVRHQVRFGRWLTASKDLLVGNPSQRVGARIVTHKGDRTVLSVGPMHLRVLPVSWGMRQVIARTGEITMIGPDAEGNAVVFVDSQPRPLTAKVVEAPEPTEPEPIARTSANGAEDDVPQWYARRHARIQLIPFVGLFLVYGALIYDAQQRTFLPGFAGFYVFLLVVSTILGITRVLGQMRLSTLLAVGRWQAHPVTVEAWKGDERRPFADLTLAMGPPGGQHRILVKHASVELVANISATGTLWMIGLPKDRKAAAVGVPGHPVVAAARFA